MNNIPSRTLRGNIARKNPFFHGRWILLLVLWLLGIVTAPSMFSVILTLPLAIILFLISFKTRQREFTVVDMAVLCMMFLFVVAPMQSLDNDNFRDSRTTATGTYPREDIVAAELIVVISVLGFIGGSRIAGDPRHRKKNLLPWLSVSATTPIKFFCVNVILAAIYIAIAGSSFFSFAGRAGSAVGSSPTAVFLLTAIIINSVCINLSSTSFDMNRSASGAGSIKALQVGTSLLIALLVNPFNSPRFVVIACWLPVLFSMFGKLRKYKVAYVGVLIGIFIIMPIVSVTSRGGVADIKDALTFGLQQERGLWIIPDADVFQTLVHSVFYMRNSPLLGGKCIMAILLFFVPRQFWIGKPIVGGLVVGEDLARNFGAGTDNLSFYIGGDFYMDFGFSGVVFGSLLCGYLTRRWLLAPYYVNGLNLNALILSASMPILIRGPVGATVGYYVCFWSYLNVILPRIGGTVYGGAGDEGQSDVR